MKYLLPLLLLLPACLSSGGEVTPERMAVVNFATGADYVDLRTSVGFARFDVWHGVAFGQGFVSAELIQKATGNPDLLSLDADEGGWIAWNFILGVFEHGTPIEPAPAWLGDLFIHGLPEGLVIAGVTP